MQRSNAEPEVHSIATHLLRQHTDGAAALCNELTERLHTWRWWRQPRLLLGSLACPCSIRVLCNHVQRHSRKDLLLDRIIRRFVPRASNPELKLSRLEYRSEQQCRNGRDRSACLGSHHNVGHYLPGDER